MKVLVIGHPQAVLGFSLAGVEGIGATTPEEINTALDTALASEGIGIILITQDASSLIQTRMDLLRQRSTVPLVVEIPGPAGIDADQPSIGEVLLRAIGVKI
ncbi:MAG: V-type ATP synthase subunit F [Anaerolineaceae bacterium]